MGDGANPQPHDHGFWSPSRGVQLTFVGVVIAAVTLYVTVVAGNDKNQDGPGTPAAVTTQQTSPPAPDDGPHSDDPPPSTVETPADVERTWRRLQSRLCDRFNASTAKLPTVDGSEGLEAFAPNLRAAAAAVRELVRESTALRVAEDHEEEVSQMVSLWSQGALHTEAMSRAAESGDQTFYEEQEAQMESKMESGMRIAFGLGATQCF